MPKVATTNSFKRRLRKKPAEERRAVLATIHLVAEEPDRPGLNIEPLRGHRGVFSARIDRNSRITFERDGDTIFFRNHCSHQAVYRSP